MNRFFWSFFGLLLFVICGGWVLFGLYVYPGFADAESSTRDMFEELLERYSHEPKLFLEDYLNGEVSPDDAIAILIMMHIEKDGLFLPLEETDTYLDLFFIHKERHREIEQMKQQIYPRSLKGNKGKR